MWVNLSHGTCPSVTYLYNWKKTSSVHLKIKDGIILKPKNSPDTTTYPT